MDKERGQSGFSFPKPAANPNPYTEEVGSGVGGGVGHEGDLHVAVTTRHVMPCHLGRAVSKCLLVRHRSGKCQLFQCKNKWSQNGNR